MAYPTDLPTYTASDPSKTLDEDNHTQRHNTMQDDIVALGTKVGIDGSADTDSHDKKIADLEAAVGSGNTNSTYDNEVPGGVIDGNNTTFTTANSFVAGSLRVYKNGIRLKAGGNDYTEGSSAFTMAIAPITGTTLLVDYMTATGVSGNADTIDGYHASSLITAAVAAAKEAIYPVGSLYSNASDSTNPATLLGFGTWAAHGAGRVSVGIDAAQSEFDTIGETGGAKTHTLLTTEMPAHVHGAHHFNSAYMLQPNTGGAYAALDGGSYGYNINTTSAGGGGAHNNLQPYIVVYVWKRTA